MIRTTILIGLTFLISCSPDRTKEIEKAMKTYDNLVLTMDADAISDTYTVDGKLDDIVGRDSIRKFLKTFVDVKVLDYQSQTKSITFDGNTATQEGDYRQKVVVKEDTLNLKGKYLTTWTKAEGKWHIHVMTTRPE